MRRSQFALILLAIFLSGCSSMSDVGTGIKAAGLSQTGSNPLSGIVAGVGWAIESVGDGFKDSAQKKPDPPTEPLTKPGSRKRANRDAIRQKFQQSLPPGELNEDVVFVQAKKYCAALDKEVVKDVFYDNCIDDLVAAGEEKMKKSGQKQVSAR